MAADHVPLLATVAVFSAVALQALALAHGDARTATVLLTSLSLSQAGAIVVVNVVRTLVVTSAGYTIGALVRHRDVRVVFVALGLSGVAAVMAPWPLQLLSTVVGIGYGVAAKLRVDRAADRLVSTDGAGVALASVGTLFVVFVIVWSTTPWWPAEEVRLEAGSRVVGYVTEEGARWTTVLVHEDRSVVRVPTSEVVERTPCGADPTAPPLLWAFTEEPGYPACPDG